MGGSEEDDTASAGGPGCFPVPGGRSGNLLMNFRQSFATVFERNTDNYRFCHWLQMSEYLANGVLSMPSGRDPKDRDQGAKREHP